MILFFIILFFMIFIFAVTPRAIFWPNKKMIWKPDIRKYQYQEEMLRVKDGKINLWHFYQFSGNNVVLFCHGTNGNISDRDYVVDICHTYHLNLVLFDYRGYGKSVGIFSQRNICEDAIFVYDDYARKYYPPERIFVWGESLGGSSAIYLAHQRKCAGLVIYATFSNLEDLSRRIEANPIVRFVGSMTMPFYDGLPNKKWIRKVECPILIIHSNDDDFIPISCAYDNYDAVDKQTLKQFVKIRGKHSAPEITIEQLDSIIQFLGGIGCLEKEEKERILKNLRNSGKNIGIKRGEFLTPAQEVIRQIKGS
jgi:pimeloyl-ACP methyl ester carboxylesterase